MSRRLGMVLTAALATFASGCPSHRDGPPIAIATPSEGISINVYTPVSGPSFALVDDRRTIVVENGVLSLDRIDPAAALPSLVIEALDHAKLVVGTCARDRIDATTAGLDQLAVIVPANRPLPKPGDAASEPRAPAPALGVLSPLVRCRVDAAPGKHFVRVLHVSPTLALRANHSVDVGDNDQATITSRFALVTPAWKMRADVSMFDGVPGTEAPLKLVARGGVMLDGSTAVIANPSKTVGGRLRRIFDGAVRDRETGPDEPGWGRESRRTVWVVLELDDPDLASGTITAHAKLPDEAARDVVVTQLDRERVGAVLRVPLWVDLVLTGIRRNLVESFRGVRGPVITQRIQLSVANSSDEPREVWVEERLRPNGRRDVRGNPAKPAIVGDVARTKLVIPPRGTERVTYSLRYD